MTFNTTYDGSAASELSRLRHLCLDLDEVCEQATPEQTSFKVGHNAFVVIETYRTPDGKAYNCVAFKASFFDLERLRQEKKLLCRSLPWRAGLAGAPA